MTEPSCSPRDLPDGRMITHRCPGTRRWPTRSCRREGGSDVCFDQPSRSLVPDGAPYAGGGARVAVLGLIAASLSGLALTRSAPKAQAAAACPTGGCSVTVDARDFPTGTPLANFNYMINVDNTKLPSDPTALSTESNSPIVARGRPDPHHGHPAGRPLPDLGPRPDHKMWGQHITLPADAAADGSLTARIDLTEQSDAHPLPLGKIRVFVFEDNAWANGAPGHRGGRPERLPGRARGADAQCRSPSTTTTTRCAAAPA